MKTFKKYEIRLRELEEITNTLKSHSNEFKFYSWLIYYINLIKSITSKNRHTEEGLNRLEQAYISSKFEIDRAKQYLNGKK